MDKIKNEKTFTISEKKFNQWLTYATWIILFILLIATICLVLVVPSLNSENVGFYTPSLSEWVMSGGAIALIIINVITIIGGLWVMQVNKKKKLFNNKPLFVSFFIIMAFILILCIIGASAQPNFDSQHNTINFIFVASMGGFSYTIWGILFVLLSTVVCLMSLFFGSKGFFNYKIIKEKEDNKIGEK